jgi:hypothetical protein
MIHLTMDFGVGNREAVALLVTSVMIHLVVPIVVVMIHLVVPIAAVIAVIPVAAIPVAVINKGE